MVYQVIDNQEKQRFEIHVDNEVAFEDYEFFTTDQGKKGIAYLHTFVPEVLSGRGIASFLIRYILDDASNKGLKVKPICPYVRAFIEKHPEYKANTVVVE